MANEKFTINTSHMNKLHTMIEEHYQKPRTTNERRQRNALNFTNSTNAINSTNNKPEQGLDVADFGDDFAAMIGVEGE